MFLEDISEYLKIFVKSQKIIAYSFSFLCLHNSVLAKSSSNHDFFPTEKELLLEAKIADSQNYNKKSSNLARWIGNSLLKSEKMEIIKQCDNLLKTASSEFPLSEKTLDCAAYWIESSYQKEKVTVAQEKENRKFKKKNLIFNFSSKNAWQKLTNVPFSEAFARLNFKKPQDAYRSATDILKQNDSKCRLVGAKLALISRLEAFLPEANAQNLMEKLYQNSLSCMTPSLEGAERTHQKLGLFRIYNGNEQKAREALRQALKVVDPNESQRTLFWLGFLEANQSPKTSGFMKNNAYWKELLEEHSLTLHAICASYLIGVDPYLRVLKEKELPQLLRPEVLPGGHIKWTRTHLETFVFDLLVARKEIEAEQKWARFVTQNSKETNLSTLLYWARAANLIGDYKDSIVMLNRFLKTSKHQIITKEFLELLFPLPYLEEILSTDKKADPLLVISLIRQESAFDPLARSQADARGLMQVLPSVAEKHYSVRGKMLFDPVTNIKLGVEHLQQLLTRYSSRVEYALSAYNAGPGNLAKWRSRFDNKSALLFIDLIPFKETRNYVSIILRNSYWYSKIIANNKDKHLYEMLQKLNYLHLPWQEEYIAQIENFGKPHKEFVQNTAPTNKAKTSG